jgi:hypothetical protein
MNNSGCLYGANKISNRLNPHSDNCYSVDFATFKILTILRSGAIMKYVNADIIFPEELLKEIQKYINGGMVYVPTSEGLRKKWGENSGSRKYLSLRNDEIRQKYSNGVTIDQLSDRFCLSSDSIKKIVYSKK